MEAGARARDRAPIPEEAPAAGTEEPEGTTAAGSEGPGETGAAGALGEIMAIHARDGQVQGLRSLPDHLGHGGSRGQVHQNEQFPTHLSVERDKEETGSRRGTATVQSVSGSTAFPAGQRSGQFLLLVQRTLPYLATQSVSWLGKWLSWLLTADPTAELKCCVMQ